MKVRRGLRWKTWATIAGVGVVITVAGMVAYKAMDSRGWFDFASRGTGADTGARTAAEMEEAA
jgi:hypothetical protein